MRLSAKRALSVAACVLGILVPTLPAAVINQTYTGSFPATISGTLPNQGSVLEEAITLSSTTNLTAFTTSYAGGGFQPNLFLFNPSGVAIGASSGQAPPGGSSFDAYLMSSNLAPGNYTLALTDFNLNQSATATSLADGFTVNYGNGTTFVDVDGVTRTGNYSITIDAATPSATPEPSTISLMLLPVLIGFVVLARKRVANVE